MLVAGLKSRCGCRLTFERKEVVGHEYISGDIFDDNVWNVAIVSVLLDCSPSGDIQRKKIITLPLTE